DSIHAVDGSGGPGVDGKGRCALYFAAVGLTGLPAHRGSGAVLALHRRVRIRYHRPDLRHIIVYVGAVATPCSYLLDCAKAGMGHLRALRKFPLAAGTKRLLWI